MANPVNKAVACDWSTAASKYASTIGGPSAEAARLVVNMAHVLNPITEKSRILDVGAGTGAVTLAIASRYPRTSVLATDFNSHMLELLKANLAAMATNGSNVVLSSLDANILGKTYAPSSFTHVFSDFVLQTATTDPLSVVRQMYDVLESGGVVGLGVWGPSPDPYKIWERACRSIDPDFTMPEPFEDKAAWRTPGALAANMQKAGFEDIKIIFKRIPFVFNDGDAFADFWLGAKNPGATSVIDAWTRECESAGRDPTTVRDIVVKHVNEEWSGGADICVEAVMGVGRRP